MKFNLFAAGLAALFCAVAAVHMANAQAPGRAAKPSIVLVHGAYADGSSWGKVIPVLQAKGYTVVAVQNPLTSLADDVAATERAVNQQAGPVVLVGHSSAGVVITEAGANPRVKALVYVSAVAPAAGQSLADAAAGFPPSPAAATVIKDEAGFLTLPAASIARYFAQDLPPAEQALIAATQGPWGGGFAAEKVARAAWRDKPSWWVIGEKDLMIAPGLQEKMAANIRAKVTRVPTGHLPMLADPGAVANVIIAAAESVAAVKPDHGAAPAGAAAANVPASFTPTVVTTAQDAPAAERAGSPRTAREVRGPAPVIPLAGEPPAKLVVDPPVSEALERGLVVIQYRAENLRIVPVYGAAALDVTPRVGHVHITVDDGPWRWLDASGEPVNINCLPAGPHKVLIELVDANHQTLDRGVVNFEVPPRPAARPGAPAVPYQTNCKKGG